jgi:hypothetical protein
MIQKSQHDTPIQDALRLARQVRLLESFVGERAAYRFEGRRLKWGDGISEENMQRLRDGEVFILQGEDGNDHSMVLMDIFGQIRERPLS